MSGQALLGQRLRPRATHKRSSMRCVGPQGLASAIGREEGKSSAVAQDTGGKEGGRKIERERERDEGQEEGGGHRQPGVGCCGASSEERRDTEIGLLEGPLPPSVAPCFVQRDPSHPGPSMG